MSKFIRTLAATAALVAGAAQATVVTPSVFPVTGTIAANQTIDFSFITLATGYASFNETIKNGGSSKAPAYFALWQGGTELTADSITGLRSKTLTFNSLDAGAYTLRLTAGAIGGTYEINSNVGLASAVPEPTGTLLALAGVGVAGLLLSRRKVS
jgi:PEP-CTERM motif